MRTALLLLALSHAVLSLSASATEQIRDRVVIDGNYFEINQLPMHGLWRKRGEASDDRALMPGFESRSTANRRGYDAIFEIKDGVLYLNRIRGRILSENVSNGEIVPGPFPVEATWYTGSIFVSIGGWSMKKKGYQYVLEFSIENGKVRETKYKDTLRTPRSWNGIESKESK